MSTITDPSLMSTTIMKGNKMLWFAAWCKADGSLVADAFNEFDDAYEFYAGNPHGLNAYELGNCQWRGVFEQDHLARNILKTQ